MKKKVFTIIGLTAIGAVAAFNANMGLHSSSLSDIALANVEALARNEGGGTLDCWNYISDDGPGNQTHKTYCGSCGAKLCRVWDDPSTCN